MNDKWSNRQIRQLMPITRQFSLHGLNFDNSIFKQNGYYHFMAIDKKARVFFIVEMWQYTINKSTHIYWIGIIDYSARTRCGKTQKQHLCTQWIMWKNTRCIHTSMATKTEIWTEPTRVWSVVNMQKISIFRDRSTSKREQIHQHTFCIHTISISSSVRLDQFLFFSLFYNNAFLVLFSHFCGS